MRFCVSRDSGPKSAGGNPEPTIQVAAGGADNSLIELDLGSPTCILYGVYRFCLPAEPYKL